MITVLKNRQIVQAAYQNALRAASNAAAAEVAATDESKEDQRPAVFTEELQERPVRTNRSGLLKAHRNMLKETLPYEQAESWIHLSQKYQRKLFGRYGQASGVDPRICFDTHADLQKQQSFEKVAFPLPLPEMIAKAKAQRQMQIDQIQQREESIAKKLEKLEGWKQDLNNKIAKKEADSLAAKERKERLMEEVRRHFGFKLDPRDERFKEMLEQKEKEDKKKQKEAKKKAKEQKMMDKLVNKMAAPKEPAAAVAE